MINRSIGTETTNIIYHANQRKTKFLSQNAGIKEIVVVWQVINIEERFRFITKSSFKIRRIAIMKLKKKQMLDFHIQVYGGLR